MGQALARHLCAQRTVVGGRVEPLVAGVWAIFGHGNVAGLGAALWEVRDRLPTLRGHNEQSMAHAAIAYAKALDRRRCMAVTTSIGPGATNLVTAAALAHVNRLPVLLLPGDVFASRLPDPVLQQVEDFGDGTVSANDCLRPVSRYFDRITRPEQLLRALPRALGVLTDPAECGPVTLALCQDVQAEAYDWPEDFFAERSWRVRRIRPDRAEIEEAAAVIEGARRPLLIAGGGVHYSGAREELVRFVDAHAVPVAETQAGKPALAWRHPLNVGSIGVTGTSAANALAREADVVIALGTRLQDFTTGSWALFEDPGLRLVQVNVCAYDAGKHGAVPVLGDAAESLRELGEKLAGWRAPSGWSERASERRAEWIESADAALAAPNAPGPPTDAQAIGATMRTLGDDAVVVGAAGGLPGELHKLWRVERSHGYHLEYGYSCMGYEIAGGLGVKLARPDREVVVMIGDGSYLMLNSEIATSVAMDARLIVVVLDNGGFGCIDRLQRACGGESFNNLFARGVAGGERAPAIDFAAHAAALGAHAERVGDIAALEAAIARARAADRTCVIVIETDPARATEAGGAWWDVPVAEVSARAEVGAAFETWREATGRRDRG